MSCRIISYSCKLSCDILISLTKKNWLVNQNELVIAVINHLILILFRRNFSRYSTLSSRNSVLTVCVFAGWIVRRETAPGVLRDSWSLQTASTCRFVSARCYKERNTSKHVQSSSHTRMSLTVSVRILSYSSQRWMRHKMSSEIYSKSSCPWLSSKIRV